MEFENKIPCIIKGEGKPLIFLHGFMCAKEYFAPQINYFSKWFKVIAYDLYGFGESKPEKAYSLNDYADEFLSIASEFNEKVSVVAHSFGCRVIFKSALKSNLIDRAVLCGVAGLKPSFSLKKAFKRTAYKLSKPFFTREVLERRFFSADYNLLNGVMKDSFKIVTSEYFDDKLTDINIPTLAIFGDKDDQTPCKIANKLTKEMPNCTKHIMKDCGHFCFAENPREFNGLVKEFLL